MDIQYAVSKTSEPIQDKCDPHHILTIFNVTQTPFFAIHHLGHQKISTILHY